MGLQTHIYLHYQIVSNQAIGNLKPLAMLKACNPVASAVLQGVMVDERRSRIEAQHTVIGNGTVPAILQGGILDDGPGEIVATQSRVGAPHC